MATFYNHETKTNEDQHVGNKSESNFLAQGCKDDTTDGRQDNCPLVNKPATPHGGLIRKEVMKDEFLAVREIIWVVLRHNEWAVKCFSSIVRCHCDHLDNMSQLTWLQVWIFAQACPVAGKTGMIARKHATRNRHRTLCETCSKAVGLREADSRQFCRVRESPYQGFCAAVIFQSREAADSLNLDRGTTQAHAYPSPP